MRTDGRIYGQRYAMKLSVVFRHFANSPLEANTLKVISQNATEAKEFQYACSVYCELMKHTDELTPLCDTADHTTVCNYVIM